MILTFRIQFQELWRSPGAGAEPCQTLAQQAASLPVGFAAIQRNSLGSPMKRVLPTHTPGRSPASSSRKLGLSLFHAFARAEAPPTPNLVHLLTLAGQELTARHGCDTASLCACAPSGRPGTSQDSRTTLVTTATLLTSVHPRDSKQQLSYPAELGPLISLKLSSL